MDINTKTTLNFGAIKDSITKKAGIEIARDSSNSTLVNFMESVKKKPILKKQFLLYKNFENTKPFESPRLAERFIEQNLQILNGTNWQELQNENATLRQQLLGGPDESTVEARNENRELFENINTIIESKLNRNFKRFDQDAKAYGKLIEHLTRVDMNAGVNEEKERPELSKMWKYVTKNALNYFNERYAALDENERDLFKVLISENKSKRESVIRLKEELSDLLESKVNASENREDTAILEAFKAKVQKEVSDEKMLSDEYIISCFELKQTLLSR